MIDHVGDRIWTKLAPLDVPSHLALGIYDLLAARIRRSHAGVAAAISSEHPHLAERIDRVLEAAPQVLSFGAAYQWVTSLHIAMRSDDVTTFDRLGHDFVRFECAAAILSRSDFDGAWAPSFTAGHGPAATIAIPLVGAFETDSTKLRVRNGELEGKLRSGARTGGIRVEAFEENYRLPRSKSLFELEVPGYWEQAHDEIVAAKELGDRLVPGLFDRYLTDVVPLVRHGNISNAGTDEAAPFVVYSSFGRNPLDLVACFAHEEAHALINCADKLLGGILPDTGDRMPVPWKPGMLRSLSNVIHGLISFGRAAQVRGRAMLLGLADPHNDEARERESRWVRDVTDQLLDGVLGELPDDLAAWMLTNVEALEPSLPQPKALETPAGSHDPASVFPWTLIAAPETVSAVTEQYASLSFGPWQRGSGDYHHQDRMDVDPSGDRRLGELLVKTLPEVIHRHFGERVELTETKAHRLRPGDSIGTHTDHQDREGYFRAVIGASALPTDGGHLRLCDQDERPVVALPLRHGDTLVFKIENPCFHDVTELRSDAFRYTIVATYRAYPDRK